MITIRLAAGLASLASLASCAAAPPVEHFSGAVAKVEFLDGDFIAGTPNRMQPTLAGSYMHHGDDRDYGVARSVEFLSVHAGTACGPAERIVKFKSRTRDAQTRTVHFKSGMPISIVARTEGASLIGSTLFGSAVASSDIDCRSVAVFTPQTGRTYTIVQNEYRDGRCEIDVRDKETNTAPPNLAIRQDIICPTA